MDLQEDAESPIGGEKDQIHMNDKIRLLSGVNGFAENKDQAKEIRLSRILPAIAHGRGVVLDFADVKYATQSFVHALIGEALQEYGDQALEQIEFRHCSEAVRSVIELVVDYSLSGFAEAEKASV